MRRRFVVLLAVLVVAGMSLPAQARQSPAEAGSTDSLASFDDPALSISVIEEDLSVRVLGSNTVLKKTRTLDVSDTGVESIGFSLDLAALDAELRSAHLLAAPNAVTLAATTCYVATPTWRLYNGYGTLVHKTWYNVKWCSSGGKITSVSNFWCDGTGGGGWAYQGCNVKTTTGTGGSYYGVSGKWTFRFGASGVYTYRYVTVSAKHNPNGTYTGNWCANC